MRAQLAAERPRDTVRPVGCALQRRRRGLDLTLWLVWPDAWHSLTGASCMAEACRFSRLESTYNAWRYVASSSVRFEMVKTTKRPLTPEERQKLLHLRPSFLFRERRKAAQQELDEGVAEALDLEILRAWDMNGCLECTPKVRQPVRVIPVDCLAARTPQAVCSPEPNAAASDYRPLRGNGRWSFELRPSSRIRASRPLPT